MENVFAQLTSFCWYNFYSKAGNYGTIVGGREQKRVKIWIWEGWEDMRGEHFVWENQFFNEKNKVEITGFNVTQCMVNWIFFKNSS